MSYPETKPGEKIPSRRLMALTCSAAEEKIVSKNVS
jgi:hypothetical protein